MKASAQTPQHDGDSPTPELKLGGNFRMTKQRREVYNVLLGVRDHPTASEVFDRVRHRVSGISLATVYNCLETLTESGVVKQVTTDRGPARYCPNLKEHAHFLCDDCGTITDVEPHRAKDVAEVWNLPADHVLDRVEVVLKGTCPTCQETKTTS